MSVWPIGCLGLECIEYPDGHVGCVQRRIDLLEATRTEVSSIHPETGEVLTTLVAVDQQEVDRLAALGLCP